MYLRKYIKRDIDMINNHKITFYVVKILSLRDFGWRKAWHLLLLTGKMILT